MGDTLEITNIEIVNGANNTALYQIDLYDKKNNHHYRVFEDAATLGDRVIKAMGWYEEKRKKEGK